MARRNSDRLAVDAEPQSGAARKSAGQPPDAMGRRRFLLLMAGAGSLVGMEWMGWLRGGTPDSGGSLAAGLHRSQRTSRALGSEVSMLALHRNGETAETAIAAAFAELERVDSIMSLYRPQSQLCVLNREGALDNPHPYLAAVLRKARAVSQASGGAFDVTVQPLWELYFAAAKAGALPDAAAIRAVARRVDWRKVMVSRERIVLEGKGMAVTLNGIAQGFAADRAMSVLRAHGIQHALVNTGEFAALGRKAEGSPWVVGIQHPRQANALTAAAALEGRCAATSGDYAASFSPDHAHNHVFDPGSGRSPNAFSSVTVVAPQGMDADALSTAIFVLGLDRGLRLLETAPGAEALLVLKNGETRATGGFPLAVS